MNYFEHKRQFTSSYNKLQTVDSNCNLCFLTWSFRAQFRQHLPLLLFVFFLLSCGPVATQRNATQHDMQSARALSPVLKRSRMQMTLFEFTWPLFVRNPTCVGGIVKPTRFFRWRHFAKRHSEEGRGRCMKMKACMPFSWLSQFWHLFTWNLEVSSICRQRIEAAR